jgi:hypothetical protein
MDMDKRRYIGLTGALLTLGLTALPALAQVGLPDDPSQPPPTPGGQFDPNRQPGQPSGRGRSAAGRPQYQPQPGQPGTSPGGQFAPADGRGFPGAPGFVPAPMMPMPQTPELAKKMRAIMALREMLAMRLTARNIGVALPILKDIRDAEKTLQSRSEQMLEEERKALLAADPDDPLPPGAGERMQQEIERFHDRQQQAWAELERAIGQEKTNGLRRLLGQGGFPPNTGGLRPMLPGGLPGSGAPGANNPVGPGGGRLPGGGGLESTPPEPNFLPGAGAASPPNYPVTPEGDPFGDDPEPRPGALSPPAGLAPRSPLNAVPGTPGRPGQRSRINRRPGAANTPFGAPEAGSPVQIAPGATPSGQSPLTGFTLQQQPLTVVPGVPGRQGRRGRASQPPVAQNVPLTAPQPPPATDLPEEGEPADPAGFPTQQPPPTVEPGTTRRGQKPRQNRGASAGNPFGAPGAGAPVPGSGVFTPQNGGDRPFFPSPRLTLTELVELLEQKQAAIRR